MDIQAERRNTAKAHKEAEAEKSKAKVEETFRDTRCLTSALQHTILYRSKTNTYRDIAIKSCVT